MAETYVCVFKKKLIINTVHGMKRVFFRKIIIPATWRIIPARQIITTSAEVTLNGGLVKESPPNPLNSGLGIILICPESQLASSYRLCLVFLP